MMIFFIMNYLQRMRFNSLFPKNYYGGKKEPQIKNENCVDKKEDKQIKLATKKGGIDEENHQIEDNDENFAGYISKIRLRGKVYKLRCEVVEVYSMTCPKCGSPLQLKYGTGKCDYCGTQFTTQFKLAVDS